MCKSCWDFYQFPDHRERNVYREEDEYEAPHKKKGKSKKPKRFKGCPQRNGSAHIYVWIEYHGKKMRWTRNGTKWVDEIWWDQTCVGCSHKKNRRYAFYSLYSKPENVYEVRKVEHDWF